MAHQAVKPYSFLMYFLVIIVSFFIGVTYAGIVDAGKGQMLAGGAIVFGYGVIGSFIGLCISIFITFKANRNFIIKFNIFLAIVIASFFTYYTIKYQRRQKEKLEQELPRQERSLKQKPTIPSNTAQEIIN